MGVCKRGAVAGGCAVGGVFWTAVAQQSRTRIAYLLAERIYVSGDVEIDDDLTVADDASVGGDLVTGVGGERLQGDAADSLSIADDMALGGNVTIDGITLPVWARRLRRLRLQGRLRRR